MPRIAVSAFFWSDDRPQSVYGAIVDLPNAPCDSGSPVEDLSQDDPCPAAVAIEDDCGPQWLWVRVRASSHPPQEVWVRYPAEQAPSAARVRPADPPVPGSLGVVVLTRPSATAAQPTPCPGTRRRRSSASPTDRNLVTVSEFAALVDVAESTVFEWLKRGLPSVKTKGLGRRILKQQAEAWLVNGGPERSAAAKRLAKTAASRRAPTNGTTHG